jgi:hypothetical protein
MVQGGNLQIVPLRAFHPYFHYPIHRSLNYD